MVVFGKALPKIRRRVNRDLAQRGLPRNKVLATVVQLLERTFIRIGNEEYAKENKSFGLTTMRNRHVDVTGERLKFSFKGKSGVSHEVDVSDRRLAKIIRQLQDLPGQDVFQYVNGDGEVRNITSQDVNDYLREITGRRVHREGFPDLGGNGPGGDGAEHTGKVQEQDGGEEEHQRRDFRRLKNSRQYPDGLPQVLRASGRAGNLFGR